MNYDPDNYYICNQCGGFHFYDEVKFNEDNEAICVKCESTDMKFFKE